MTYWNIITNAPWSESTVAHILNPSDADRYAAGRREVIPAKVPDGHVVTARRVEIDGDTAREVVETVSQAEYDAAITAAEAAAIDAEDKRIAALPSVAALITENEATKTKLAAVESDVAKVNADMSAVKKQGH
jgi:hypothetical protein